MTITVRYFAAARAATGIKQETLDLPGVGTLDQILTALGQRHGDTLTRLLRRCSFFVDGASETDRATPVRPDSTLDVLPPFAGG